MSFIRNPHVKAVTPLHSKRSPRVCPDARKQMDLNFRTAACQKLKHDRCFSLRCGCDCHRRGLP